MPSAPLVQSVFLFNAFALGVFLDSWAAQVLTEQEGCRGDPQARVA